MPLPPIDYLVIGHITRDLAPQGATAGGTVAYSGLTAAAFGLRVGAVTSFGPDMQMSKLGDVWLHAIHAPETTTFTNEYTPTGRRQRLTGRALPLSLDPVPQEWRSARIVHLGPVAAEVNPALTSAFPQAYLGLTPQGWFREWDESGTVTVADWRPLKPAMAHARAVVLSLEDVANNEAAIKDIAEACPLLVVTDGAHGARLYQDGRMRMVPAPPITVVDPTGAGDIFAAAFFIAHSESGDPLLSARRATIVAAASVGRRGLASVPTRREAASARAAAGS